MSIIDYKARVFQPGASQEETLFHAVLYRNFGVLYQLITEFPEINTDFEIKSINFKQVLGWNLDFIQYYDTEHDTNLLEWAKKILVHAPSDLDCTPKNDYHQGIDTAQGRVSIFDALFPQGQPLLSIEYIEAQTLPAKQVCKNHCSLVLDEVGAGKTVTALYTMAHVLDTAKADKRFANILIVCPSQLKNKWEGDISRQLGRYSHIVTGGDENCEYQGSLKNAYFKEGEERIFIISNITINELDSFHFFLPATPYNLMTPWDLIIIDESHLCANNYKLLRGNNIMMMTATPIGKGIGLDHYKSVMINIIGQNQLNRKSIAPLKTRNPTEDDIFTCRFREDYGKQSSERNIVFLSCQRAQGWLEKCNILEREMGFLTAMHYAQDDTLLWDMFNKHCQHEETLERNPKLEKLQEYVTSEENQGKSYIIFCEHHSVVNRIYETFHSLSIPNQIVAKKYGEVEYLDGGRNRKGLLLTQLEQHIRKGKQVLFIVTGKTGGTGLNLGEFQGVIHYELPYTNTALEQRYGRVDRLDKMSVQGGNSQKDMIFLLNECENEEFFLYNRMLAYCVTKINIACQALPVRNTVLFHPNMITQMKDFLLASLKVFTQEQLEKKSAPNKKHPSFPEQDLEKLLSEMSIDNQELRELVQQYGKDKKAYLTHRNHVKQYKEVKKMCQNFLIVLDPTQNYSNNLDLFETSDFEENVETNENTPSPSPQIPNEEKEDPMGDAYFQDCRALITQLESFQVGQITSNGIFYMEDNHIRQNTVDAFREALRDD